MTVWWQAFVSFVTRLYFPEYRCKKPINNVSAFVVRSKCFLTYSQGTDVEGIQKLLKKKLFYFFGNKKSLQNLVMRWMYSSDLCSLEMVLASWWSFFGESLYFSLLFSFLTWPSLWPLCAAVSPSWRVRWPGWPSGVMQTSPAAKGIAAGQKEWSEITDNVRGAWWALEALQCKRNINKTWPLSSDCFLQLWMALKSSPSKHCGFRTKKTILLHTVQSGKKNSNTVYKTDNETNVDSPSRMLAS